MPSPSATSALSAGDRNSFISLTAIFAASSMGHPYTPVEMQGKAMDQHPFSAAMASELR